MKLVKVLVELGMARSGAEAQRLVKQGAVLVGGCIPPCNARLAPYTCTCNGWQKVTNPVQDIEAGTVVRIGNGNWRLLQRDGVVGFDMVPGIGWVPENLENN